MAATVALHAGGAATGRLLRKAPAARIAAGTMVSAAGVATLLSV